MIYLTHTPIGIRSGLLVPTLVLAALLSGTSCSPPGLSNSFASPEALAQAVLDALAQDDREAMMALMVTREEHLRLLWEQLPESNHLPFDYARELNERNSNKGISQAISRYGGDRFELVSIEFTEPPEEYRGFTLHFGTVLTARRISDGAAGTLPILDVVLEYNGRWKLMNYEE